MDFWVGMGGVACGSVVFPKHTQKNGSFVCSHNMNSLVFTCWTGPCPFSLPSFVFVSFINFSRSAAQAHGCVSHKSC